MENDCAFANLEDKYTFKFKEKQKVAVESILHGPLDWIIRVRPYPVVHRNESVMKNIINKKCVHYKIRPST